MCQFYAIVIFEISSDLPWNPTWEFFFQKLTPHKLNLKKIGTLVLSILIKKIKSALEFQKYENVGV
jgi:hypothetical protein